MRIFIVALLALAAVQASASFDVCEPFSYVATSAYFDHGVWNTNTAAGHSMWLPDIFDGSCGPASPFYSFVPGSFRNSNSGLFTEDLIQGTATLKGTLRNEADASFVLDAELLFGNRVNPGEAGHSAIALHKEMFVNPGSQWEDSNATSWYYYTSLEGTLTDPSSGAKLHITTVAKAPPRVGIAGNGKNFNLGLGLWFIVTQIEAGSSAQQCAFVSSYDGHGDFNLDLNLCQNKCPPLGFKVTSAHKLPNEDYNTNAGAGFALWLNDWHDGNCGDLGGADTEFDFEFVAGSGFSEFGTFTVGQTDGRLVGKVAHVSNPNHSFLLDVKFSGLVYPGESSSPAIDPHYEMFIEPGKTIERRASKKWFFFQRFEGVLIGQGDLAGYTIKISGLDTTPMGKNHKAQFGIAANGKNVLFGLGAWFSREVFFFGQPVESSTVPDGQPSCRVKAADPSKHGDFNVNLHVCDAHCPPGQFQAVAAFKEPKKDVNPNTGDGFAFWLDDWNDWTNDNVKCGDLGDVNALRNDFRFAKGYGFQGMSGVFDFRGAAGATLKGVIEHVVQTKYRFLVNVEFDHLGSANPHIDFTGIYRPDQVDASAGWKYYKHFKGTLTGLGPLAGYVIEIESVDMNGYGFQIGQLANGKNYFYGASGWFTRKITFHGASEPECKLKRTGKTGDINIDLEPCSICENGPLESEFAPVYGIKALKSRKLPGQDWNPNTVANFAVFLPELTEGTCAPTSPLFDFVYTEQFNEYGSFIPNDASGTALLAGALQNSDGLRFDLKIYLSGKVSPGDADYDSVDPHYEMFLGYGKEFERSASASWVYYRHFVGELVGRGNLEGYVIKVHNVGPMGGKTYGFQVGLAANGKGVQYGASGWFDREVFYNGAKVEDSTTPASQPSDCRLKAHAPHGDVNIDLELCLPCVAGAWKAEDSFKVDGDFNPNSGDGFSLWLDDWNGWPYNAAWKEECGDLGDKDSEKNDFSFVDYHGLTEGGLLQPVPGGLRLRGYVQHKKDSRYVFWVDITFTDAVKPGDAEYSSLVPHLEMTVEPGKSAEAAASKHWVLYRSFVGVLQGVGYLSGYTIVVTPKEMSGSPTMFQLGMVASGKNLRLGAAGWIDRKLYFNGDRVLSRFNPPLQPACYLKPTEKHGDININLVPCPHECVPDQDQIATGAQFLPGEQYNLNTIAGHSVWLQQWYEGDCNVGDASTENSFVFDEGAGFPAYGIFTENSDGTASLKGYVRHVLNANYAFLVDFVFSNRVNPGDADYGLAAPHYEMVIEPGASQEQANSANWYYYRSFSGSFIGVKALLGYVTTVTPVNMPSGPAKYGFQVGLGANGKNLLFGGASWFVRSTTFNGELVQSASVPAGQPSECRVKQTDLHGDINIDINPCVWPCPKPYGYRVESAYKLPNEDYNVNAGDGFAFWLDDWNANACGGNLGDHDWEKNDFEFTEGLGFPPYGVLEDNTSSGKGRLRGLIQQIKDHRFKFVADLWLENRVAPGDADYSKSCPFNDFWKKEANGQRVSRAWAASNSTSWTYFMEVKGQLVGVGPLTGYKVELHGIKTMTPSKCLPDQSYGFQCGKMANGKNKRIGCSSWFSRKVFFNGVEVQSESVPAHQPALCRLKPTSKHGDINVDIWPCP